MQRSNNVALCMGSTRVAKTRRGAQEYHTCLYNAFEGGIRMLGIATDPRRFDRAVVAHRGGPGRGEFMTPDVEGADLFALVPVFEQLCVDHGVNVAFFRDGKCAGAQVQFDPRWPWVQLNLQVDENNRGCHWVTFMPKDVVSHDRNFGLVCAVTAVDNAHDALRRRVEERDAAEEHLSEAQCLRDAATARKLVADEDAWEAQVEQDAAYAATLFAEEGLAAARAAPATRAADRRLDRATAARADAAEKARVADARAHAASIKQAENSAALNRAKDAVRKAQVDVDRAYAAVLRAEDLVDVATSSRDQAIQVGGEPPRTPFHGRASVAEDAALACKLAASERAASTKRPTAPRTRAMAV